MEKDSQANPQHVAGRMPQPERDPAASTKIGPERPDPADDAVAPHQAESASTDNSDSKPGDARQQILDLKGQAEELRIVGYKWQKAAQAALAAERQLTALESDLKKVRSERDDAVAKAAEAQATVDAARKRAVVLEADLEKVRGERDSTLAKVSEAQAASDEARKGSAAVEADMDKVRKERDGALAKAGEAQAAADEARKRSVGLETDLEKVRSERDDSLARAEAAERALQAEATGTHPSRREFALNGIVAAVFIAGLLLLLVLNAY